MPVEASEVQRDALISGLTITAPIAMRINGNNKAGDLLGYDTNLQLTDEERATLIDAQALQLIGTAQRLKGDADTAQLSLTSAHNRAISVRDGARSF